MLSPLVISSEAAVEELRWFLSTCIFLFAVPYGIQDFY
jgi:TRAP-type mannitol/chloroaromatic compound transport system permease small subunit